MIRLFKTQWYPTTLYNTFKKLHMFFFQCFTVWHITACTVITLNTILRCCWEQWPLTNMNLKKNTKVISTNIVMCNICTFNKKRRKYPSAGIFQICFYVSTDIYSFHNMTRDGTSCYSVSFWQRCLCQFKWRSTTSAGRTISR